MTAFNASREYSWHRFTTVPNWRYRVLVSIGIILLMIVMMITDTLWGILLILWWVAFRYGNVIDNDDG